MIRCVLVLFVGFVFFFKQKTAYEMLSGDWSSDVCSSDLDMRRSPATAGGAGGAWPCGGSGDAIRFTPAAGTRCHEQHRSALAPDLAALVDGDRCPDPCRAEGHPGFPEWECPGGIDRAVWDRDRAADDSHQARHLADLPVPADDLTPGAGRAAPDRTPAGGDPQEIQE